MEQQKATRITEETTAAPRGRRAYEAPRAEFVPLRVEERLMVSCNQSTGTSTGGTCVNVAGP